MNVNVVHAIPIARGVGKETLSYFTGDTIQAGSIIRVPLRNKTVPALVVSIESAMETKAEIKSKPYSMKKIEGVIESRQVIAPGFMRAVKQCAEYHVSTTGSALFSLFPKGILDNLEEERPLAGDAKRKQQLEVFVLQTDDEERMANYRSLIREEFARGGSVFFCLPTVEDIKTVSKELLRGIEQYTFVLHSGLTQKEIQATWKKALQEEHSVLIIGTGSFIGIPRADVGTLIIERESSRAYKSIARPFIDIRTFAEYFAKETGVRLIFGDTLLRTETIWRYKEGHFVELAPLKFRSLTTAETRIIDTRGARGENEEWKALKEDLLDLVQMSKENNEELFIFVARRGISGITACGDCGTIVTCKNCTAPVALHKGATNANKRNFFLCHKCGEKRSAEEKCAHCDSWKLVPLGSGIELVEDELRKAFPDIQIFRIDKDKTTTAVRAGKEARGFLQSAGSVLLGTEMALPFLDRKIANTAVANLDTLFSLPDFRINEKVLHLLLKLRSLTTRRLLLQTRLPDEPVLQYGIQGNLIDFYREEIEERKNFSYPPFSTLIKITLTGKKEEVTKEMEKLKAFLEPHEMIAFPALTASAHGTFVMHALLRLPRQEWVNKELLGKLLSLPPSYEVVVDPDTLL